MEEKKHHYWCKNCGIPVLGKLCLACGSELTKEIAMDFKPVMRKEIDYYKEAAAKNDTFSERRFPLVLYRTGSKLISDISKGETHFRIVVKSNELNDEGVGLNYGEFAIDLKESEQSKRSNIRSFFLDNKSYMKTLIRGNLGYLQQIEQEGIDFIKRVSEKYDDHYQICSFSGGKDSAVTAYVVKQAIGSVPIVYSDTGIEFPATKEYVRQYGDFFGDLVYLEKCVDFMDMCKILGPPSRTMRWCCFTSKGAPISKYYGEMSHKKVLSFDGIRKLESNARSLYSRERDNTKYEKQFSAYPILHWSSLEVWLYILWKEIPYNPLYEHGFARAGCWACPNNTKFDIFLFSKAYPDMVKDWFSFIEEYSRQQSAKMEEGHSYDYSWIEDGDWKKRRVKYENEENLTDLTVSDDGRYELKLKYPIKEDLKEFFKVFGHIERSVNKHVKVSGKDLSITYVEDGHDLVFTIKNTKKETELKRLVVRQINKSYNCVNCGACVGSCPQGAISINDEGGFQIDSDKCVNCLICTGTTYIDMSCIAIHYRADRIYIKLHEV